MHASHGIAWIAAALIMAMLGLAPGIFDLIASQIGIAYPPALAFTMALAVVAIKLLIDDIERSRLKMRQSRLVQRIAILENEVKKAKKPRTPTVSEAE